ncbi:hypothetical protein [Lysinibacillus xylanilyticus]|uniref:hypothetical protein n=1 Tax=Lysinibacillus xylanilyticus TaxID=582475 RepID=UPI003D004E18
MSIQTKNYGFTKDNENDFYNVNTVNNNLDKIDTEMNRIEKKIDESEREVDYVKHPADGGTTAGTATTYTCNTSPNPTALVDKMGLMITAHVDSGASPTLKWGPLVAKSIKKPNGSAANLKKNGLYTVRYNSVNDSFILQGEGGEYGTAIASQVLAPYTIGTDNGIVTGTMANKGATVLQVNALNQKVTIPQGYHDGTGYAMATYAPSQYYSSGAYGADAKRTFTWNFPWRIIVIKSSRGNINIYMSEYTESFWGGGNYMPGFMNNTPTSCDPFLYVEGGYYTIEVFGDNK